MSNPPYGVDYNPSQNLERENLPRFANPMQRNEQRNRQVLPSIIVKHAPQLMENVALMEELGQARKELQVTQQEVKQLSEAMARRMSAMESRLQAGEANTRSLDRREATASNSLLQLKTEMEVKLRDVMAEVQRSRRLFEQELQNQTERMKRELEEREEANVSAETLAREAGRQCRAAEEKMRKMEEDMRAGLERRTQMVLDSLRKYELGSVEKFSALEQVVQLERGERQQEAAGLREELNEVMKAIKEELERESDGVARMESELRSELGTMQAMLQERTRSLREEIEGARLRLEGMLREGLEGCKLEGEEMRRRMDGFAMLFERERKRQKELVQSSSAQMKEKVQSVQGMWKEMQQESVRIRSLASQVQEETSMQVKMMSERMEEGMQALRGVQERQGEQLGDTKQQQARGMAELREKVSSSLIRVHSELESSLREERQTRQSILLRLEEHEGVTQRMLQEQTNFEEGVEQRLRHAQVRTSEDVNQLSARMDAIYLDVQAQTEEQGKRLHTLEVLNREKIADLANDLHTANERQWEEILDIKKTVRAIGSQERAKENSLIKQIEELRRRLNEVEHGTSAVAINPQRDLNEDYDERDAKSAEYEDEASGEEEEEEEEEKEEEERADGVKAKVKERAQSQEEGQEGRADDGRLGGEGQEDQEKESAQHRESSELGESGKRDVVEEEEILEVEDGDVEVRDSRMEGEERREEVDPVEDQDEVNLSQELDEQEQIEQEQIEEEQIGEEDVAGQDIGAQGGEESNAANPADADESVQWQEQQQQQNEEDIGGEEEQQQQATDDSTKGDEGRHDANEEEAEMIQTAEEESMNAVEQAVEDVDAAMAAAEQEEAASADARQEGAAAEMLSPLQQETAVAEGNETGVPEELVGMDGAGAAAEVGEASPRLPQEAVEEEEEMASVQGEEGAATTVAGADQQERRVEDQLAVAEQEGEVDSTANPTDGEEAPAPATAPADKTDIKDAVLEAGAGGGAGAASEGGTVQGGGTEEGVEKTPDEGEEEGESKKGVTSAGESQGIEEPQVEDVDGKDQSQEGTKEGEQQE